MEKQFSIRESLKSAWSLIKGENLFLLIGLVLGYLVLYGILSVGQGLTKGSGINFIFTLVQIFVSSIFSLGLVKISLQIIAGEEPQFSVFSDVISLFLRYLGASIVKAIPIFFFIFVGFVVVLGMLLGKMDFSTIQAGDMQAIVTTIEESSKGSSILAVLFLSLLPIIYLSVRWMFFIYLIVDKNSGAIESLKQSWKMTEGNFWHLILFGLTCGGLAILGLLALILGVFVVMPLIMVAQALIYKKLVSKLTIEKEVEAVPVVE